MNSIEYSEDYNNIDITVNTNQLSVLKSTFIEIFPHFEKFKIKLPYAGGQNIEIIGLKDRINEFYENLRKSKIFRQNKNSFQVSGQSKILNKPIYERFVIVYIPDNQTAIAKIGYGDKITTIQISEISGFIEKLLKKESSQCPKNETKKNKKLFITNNGKMLATALLDTPLYRKIWIDDLLLLETIIKKGEGEAVQRNFDRLMDAYKIPEGRDIYVLMKAFQLIWVDQSKKIDELKLSKIRNLESKLIWVTAAIENNGFGIDQEGLEKYLGYCKIAKRKLKNQFERNFPGVEISISKSDFWNYLIKKKCNRIRKNPENESVIIDRLWTRWRRFVSFKRMTHDIKNVEKILDRTNSNGRCIDVIDQYNTITGRFYRDLQTTRKKGPLRSFFIASPGHKLICADYSQQELRVAAGLSQDKRLVSMFKSGKDPYWGLANALFKRQKTVSGRHRILAKTMILALINGMTNYELLGYLRKSGFRNIKIERIKDLMVAYYRIFPTLFNWQGKVIADAKKMGYVDSLLGRRRTVSMETKKSSLLNFPIQGTASDGFKKALIYVQSVMDKCGGRIVHIVHDEIIIEVEENIADKVSRVVKASMERAYNEMFNNKMPFLVEPEIRDSWGEP